MRFFAGAVCLDGGPAPAQVLSAVRTACSCAGQPLQWATAEGALAVVGPRHGASPPGIARWGSVLAVGVARLDNRADAVAALGEREPPQSDLALAARIAMRRGVSGVARLLGDFAFVAWDDSRRTLVAARDTFGVKQLYYALPNPGVVTFASRADLLGQEADYDLEYLAAWISYCGAPAGQTVFRGVHALPPASVLRIGSRGPVVANYWNPSDVQARDRAPRSERDECDAFRTLLIEAVRQRLTAGPHTWSHLSGGLDSSSVVGIAQWLAEQGTIPTGLGGTVSFVDPLGTAADERMFSDAVVERYHVRNEALAHQLDRTEALLDPPLFDQPNSASYGVAARDRQVARTIQAAGGQVLLTGLGGDNLVLGTMFFFADWVATGHVAKAVREMAHRAALGRVSFWQLAYQNAMLPLLSGRLRRWLIRDPDATVPPWVAPAMVRRYRLDSRTAQQSVYGGRRGHAYAHAQVETVAAIPSTLRDGVVGDVLDIRHPFLHRPLVELALGLAPDRCVRPHARKWILREAMRGILPELVRTRVGKGTGGGLTSWSLAHEQPLRNFLLRDSLLAQLGVIDPNRLRTAAATACRGGEHEASLSAMVQPTLDVELWLRIRTGRWVPAHARELAADHLIGSTHAGQTVTT